MNIPLLDLKLQNLALESELTAAFLRVLRSGQYILGPEVESLEAQLAEYLDVKHTIAVSSGTDAILLALMALKIGPGDEVICPSFTFFATAGCVARVGAKPVFADSCPVCFNLDVADAARRVSARTKAIIPVHLFGQSADMDAVTKLAQEHGLAVIEDAAQAFGAKHQGRFVGTIGTCGTFSFFPSKNLGCLGDGGLIVTNDGALAEMAFLLRNHGAKPKYFHRHVGGNFRLDALQAALLKVKLPQAEHYNQARRDNAAYYTEKLSKSPGVAAARAVDCLCLRAEGSNVVTLVPDSSDKAASSSPGSAGILPASIAFPAPARMPAFPGARTRSEDSASLSMMQPCNSELRITLPLALPRPGSTHIWNQYTLRVAGEGQRNRLRDLLAARGVGSEIYYPVPLHRQECFSSAVEAGLKFPVADRLAEECLSLPIYPELSRSQQDGVIRAVGDFFRN